MVPNPRTKVIVNDIIYMDKPPTCDMIVGVMKNRYVIQCERMGLTPIQALSALEQLEALVDPADRPEVVEAINHFSLRVTSLAKE